MLSSEIQFRVAVNNMKSENLSFFFFIASQQLISVVSNIHALPLLFVLI